MAARAPFLRPMLPESATQAHRGFTLIELVAVLVILGVLAAVAVPKIYDARDDVWNQTIKSNAAALRAGVDSARLAWRVRGGGVPVTDLPGWHDGTADFTANGWLVGTSYSGGALTHALCAEIWRAAIRKGPSVVAWNDANAPTPGYDYAAIADPGVGCDYVPLKRDGTRLYNKTTGNVVYIGYDPLGWWWGGVVWSADRDHVWTYFPPGN
jgi:prepilin-type N-terminal cleavage/methylation domain-containing protein